MLAAVIQARMGSTRLPGKTLAEICGKPLLLHLVERVYASQFVKEVIVATTTKPQDDVLVEFTERLGLKCFRGNEDDVLDRIYQAARYYEVDSIVRVTPDCPLMDPHVMDKVIEIYLSGEYDYVTNTSPYTYPDGLDVEIFSFKALEQAWREAQLPSEREHVTSYIRKSGYFRLFNVEGPVDLSRLKWSVDSAEDFAFVRAVYAKLYNGNKVFHLEDVIRLINDNPELQTINVRSVVNEGYYRSIIKDPPVAAKDHNLSRSFGLREKAQKLIPGCTQTFSKGPTQFVQGIAPVFLQRGKGSHVWDVDGNEYIDYMGALGPIVLGYSYPAVNEAAKHQLEQGVSFSLPHPLEIEVAELLCEIIPCAEMVRFGKNGSDATSGAVRVARAYTGRDIVACCGYHGWQDWYIGTTTRNQGVPKAVRELTIPFEYNNIESLKRIFTRYSGQVAGVIMEPVGVEEPRKGFLQQVRELTQSEGALLIFDEVVTGFRLALGGAQEYFSLVPDLACFGKALGNGFPISAVVGRREIMQLFDEIFFSFTYGGEALSLAAALATVRVLQEKNVIPLLWKQGEKLKDGYNVLAKELKVDAYTQCVGYPPRTIIMFKDEKGQESLILRSVFQQELLKRGILSGGYHNVALSHTDADVDYTLRVYRDALKRLSIAIASGNPAQSLEGEAVQAVFRSP